ncbi:DUF5666 domain-containing protein [Rhodoferax ferrireducens]|uniref:DUF5666 domain-containing protein n=1 Tax=Rhodoferax ferrireducens TaxID=192843 RepID=UPI00298DA810|nr:DUF5666 domain-containing protein [Rhodoferax ferrireducens]WPC68602.1 DUF5666 domain-containing protein [Rhodoferax ferrireducens]
MPSNPSFYARQGGPTLLRLIVVPLAAWLCLFLPMPVQAQNVCATQASPVNPGSRSGVAAIMKDPGGIGGTGMVASKPLFGEGGIGGTGIVGVITGFASICVNGIEVHYDEKTPVRDNGQSGSASQLAVGQVVAVTATEDGAQITARGISMIHTIVGPVSALDVAKGHLEVVGQEVSALESVDLTVLHTGDWVRVGGYRTANGAVMASRVDPFSVQATEQLAQVRGPVSVLQGNTVMVGDTQIDLASLALPHGLAVGQELWVSGMWNDGVLHARQIAVNPTMEGLGHVNKVVLEGYIHQLSENEIGLGFQSLKLAQGVHMVGGTKAELAVNRRVQISGRVETDQRITVDRIEFKGSTSKSSMAGSAVMNSAGGTGGTGSSGSMGGSGGMGGSSGSGSSGGMGGSGGMGKSGGMK